MARLLMETVQGVRNHFPNRAGEWFCAFVLTDWGIRVAMPGGMFSASLSFRQMETIMSEPLWGVLAILIGASRILALMVNGSFAQKLWYSRRSPHIRAAMAFLSIGIWSLITIGLWRSGVNTTGLSIYPYIAIFDIYNAIRAGRDAGSMDGSYDIARGQPAHA